MRPRILLLILAAVLIAVFVVLSLADSLIVDLMWFTALGYRSVFTVTFFAGLSIFAAVFAIYVCRPGGKRPDRPRFQPRA